MHEHPIEALNRVEDGPVLLARSDFDIRLASNRERRHSSSVLVQRMYAWRGYRGDFADELPLVDRITLQACRDSRVFATLSLTLDSPAGLAADALYRRDIDAYRMSGAVACELTRFAVAPPEGSKDVLGALFHLAYLYGAVLGGATDVFIEVNPRHVRFYERMLHFARHGDARLCPRVHAPAVLMHLEVDHVREQIARCGGGRAPTRTSLYDHFFSKQEEEALLRRIVRHEVVARRQQTVKPGPVLAVLPAALDAAPARVLQGSRPRRPLRAAT